EPLGERLVVLLGEDRRRHDDRDLLAVLDRLEGRPQRDLRLAVPDIADDEAVHRSTALHVALGVLDGLQLVGRFRIREGVLHLDLPWRVAAERESLCGLARRVETEELARDLLRGLLGAAFGHSPLAPAEGGEGRRRAA